MSEPRYDSSVFINCPFDVDFEPILQAMLFCIVYLGLDPRIATEDGNSAEIRLSKIFSLISESKYSIHDLSRSEARTAGELARHNMPFELGLDYGCRQFKRQRQSKKILILDEQRHRYQASISDLAGCDIKFHSGDFEKAIGVVRTWLVAEAGVEAIGATKIRRKWIDFQEWYVETQLAAGSSEDDIFEYPTSEMLTFMYQWVAEGEPL